MENERKAQDEAQKIEKEQLKKAHEAELAKMAAAKEAAALAHSQNLNRIQALIDAKNAQAAAEAREDAAKAAAALAQQNAAHDAAQAKLRAN